MQNRKMLCRLVLTGLLALGTCSAATLAEAADAALNGSMAASAGGCDTFYVGTTKDMAREFIDACSMWAKAYDYAASEIGEEVLADEDNLLHAVADLGVPVLLHVGILL